MSDLFDQVSALPVVQPSSHQPISSMSAQIATNAPHPSVSEFAERVKKLGSLSFDEACQEVDDLYTSASQVHGSLVDIYRDLQKWIKSHQNQL